MDGGASASDPFRLPSPAEELVHPFGNGLVLRYGHTMSLVASTVALVGMTAELPPSMEAPFDLLYFVASDNLGMPMTVLRAVLKEGLKVPGCPPKALVIEKLQTLEVYRKQGLATNLINFVKDIARAHGIGLYASCGLYAKTFWELRGFEEETQLHLNVCENEDLAVCTVLLRAGEFFTEYRPATELQMSSVKSFCHFSGFPYDTVGTVTPNCNENSLAASASTASAKGMTPVEAGAACGIGGKTATARDIAGVGHRCLADGVHVPPGVWTDTSPPQHDAEEEARRFLAAADAGASLPTLPQGSPPGAESGSESDDESGASVGLGPWMPSTRSAQNETPGSLSAAFCQGFTGSFSSCISTSSAMDAVSTADALRTLGWSTSVPGQPGSAAMAAVAAVGGEGAVELGGWKPEPAIEDSALGSYPREPLAPVGQASGSGIPTIGEQEEAQIQLAIELSLSNGDACMGGARSGSGGAGDAVGVKKTAAEAFPMAASPALLVNDADTNEEPGNSVKPPTFEVASELRTPAAVAAVIGSSLESTLEERLESGPAVRSSLHASPALDALSGSRRKEVPSPGGLEYDGKRTRRRNEDGTSTPGEPSPVCPGVEWDATIVDRERWRGEDGLDSRRRVCAMGSRVNVKSADDTYQIGTVDDGGIGFGASLGGVGATGAEDESAGLDGILATVDWERDDGEDAELMQAVEASRQSHAEEMIRRATQESQRVALEAAKATKVVTEAGEGEETPVTPGMLEGAPPPVSEVLMSSLEGSNGGDIGGERSGQCSAVVQPPPPLLIAAGGFVPNGHKPRLPPLQTDTEAGTHAPVEAVGANDWQRGARAHLNGATGVRGGAVAWEQR